MITAEKITLHFKMADLEFAKRLYADWDYFSKCSLVDVLDSFLSTYDSDDIYLEIDRLDLDLGTINQDEFYDEFSRRLRRELERQFRVSLINNTILTHHNIAEWLRSPTLSRHEKQARLERLLRENPYLVTRFIHESREESERKELVEILEDSSIKEIIYTESESHTEVGVPEYWYHLYRWLYEHYPFNGVAMFGDKAQFKHHLTTKLLTFIQKRGYSTYHTRLSLTIELLMEVFGEEYYLSILKVIYYNQPLDSYDRPLSSDYYYWEIYYILLKASLIEPWQGAKNDTIAIEKQKQRVEESIAEWLRSPTLSHQEKRERLERVLSENPFVVTYFIHESRDENDRKELAEILEHKLVSQIIHTESESHTEVGLSGYWYALYCWLYEYYPFNGVETFGDKPHFKQYLNVKLLSFIHKRGYSEYLSKRELTLQFVKELFSERYYINVLRAIYQNQSLDEVGRPLSGGYYIWEIYTLLLEIGVVAPPHSETKNGSQDLIYWSESEKVENLLLTLRGGAKREAGGSNVESRPYNRDRDIIRYFSKRRAQELLQELKSTRKERLFAMCDEGSMERESVVELLSTMDSSQARVIIDLVRYVEQRVVDWGIFSGSSAELTSSLTKTMLLFALYLMELGDGARPTKEEITSKFLSMWHSVLGGDGEYRESTKWQRAEQEILKSNEIKEPKASIEVVEIEQKTDMEQRQERDHYTIPNAGLCLLSPWFPRLFAMVGLLTKDQKDFTDQEARVRAVFILQRLVRSQEVEWRDSELAFNRILVGLPFSTPLPKRMELTKEEITIVESMLQGVKTNWGVLKNTSIEGFQSSFIERGGEIRLGDESWRLRVETRSFDMLLDSLPWAYSLIRLPWLKRWINVSWRETQTFDI